MIPQVDVFAVTVVPLFFVGIAAVVAAITDVVQFRVYNILTFPLTTGGLVFAAIVGKTQGVGFSLSGIGLALGIAVLPYAMGLLGAGDAKFLMGIGAWIGPSDVLSVLLIGCIATGIYSAVVIVLNRGPEGILANLRFSVFGLLGSFVGAGSRDDSVQTVVRQADRRERLVPFSAMCAIGVWCVVLSQLSATWMVAHQ